MKIRNGFVSNSSSSSFICNVCNGAESGWDLCLDDAGMFNCENGHCVHIDCAPDYDDSAKDDLVDENGDRTDEYYDWEYNIPSKMCPICSLSNIPHNIQTMYLKAKLGISSADLAKELREKFKSLKELKEWVSKNTKD